LHAIAAAEVSKLIRKGSGRQPGKRRPVEFFKTMAVLTAELALGEAWVAQHSLRARWATKSPVRKSVLALAAGSTPIKLLPDEAFVTDGQCEALTGLSRTSLQRLERSRPLLQSVKLGPKRKVRQLGNVRVFVQECLAAARQLQAA
jgi:hypothetical protein